MKALGFKQLTVVLTDCLKTPPPPTENLLDYLESFCSSLGPEPSLTPFQQLMEECMQELEPMKEHVWDTDANEWLDKLIEELDLQTELESFENDFDFTDFIEDFNNDEWENVWNDVIDNFDSNLLP